MTLETVNNIEKDNDLETFLIDVEEETDTERPKINYIINSNQPSYNEIAKGNMSANKYCSEEKEGEKDGNFRLKKLSQRS